MPLGGYRSAGRTGRTSSSDSSTENRWGLSLHLKVESESQLQQVEVSSSHCSGRYENLAVDVNRLNVGFDCNQSSVRVAVRFMSTFEDELHAHETDQSNGRSDRSVVSEATSHKPHWRWEPPGSCSLSMTSTSWLPLPSALFRSGSLSWRDRVSGWAVERSASHTCTAH